MWQNYVRITNVLVIITYIDVKLNSKDLLTVNIISFVSKLFPTAITSWLISHLQASFRQLSSYASRKEHGLRIVSKNTNLDVTIAYSFQISIQLKLNTIHKCFLPV